MRYIRFDYMVNSDEDGGNYAEVMAASPLDIKEYANSYAFVVDMPGLDPSDVRVQVKADNVILISSERRRVEEEGAKYISMERRMGKFKRKFALPDNANTGQITTVSRNGELTVTVEKRPKAIEAKHEPLLSRGDQRKLRIDGVDRISLLPDELLVVVLSLLSFKEATATSLLSRRWRFLHAFPTKLDFDGTKVMRKLWNWSSKKIDEAMRKFPIWVDGVVRLNRSSRLEKFRVVLHLTESDTPRIDNWVRFAFSRKVESLELLSALLGRREEHYTLNLHKFDHCELNLLRKLSTQCVKVSGEAVEMLLRSCPLLEQLSIAYSAQLLCLEIIKPFPSFRSLEIINCWNLSSVVVDDSNIVSVKYYGKRVNKVVLVNVPLLTEIWIYGTISELEEDVVEMFSSVLPQLHTFKLGFSSMTNLRENDFCSTFSSSVKMSNLKQLVVDITYVLDDDHDLLPLIGLIRASPRLQRFVIEEAYDKSRAGNFVEAKPIEIPKASRADRMSLKAYTELKVVEFVGYRGVRKHFELLKNLVENAIALETIVVDPWGFKKMRCILSFDRIRRSKYNEKVFARANALKQHLVPFGINVKIL